MGFKNINCAYADNPGGYCKNKLIRRSMLGIGSRICKVYDDDGAVCEYQKKFDKPPAPPPAPPLKLHETIEIVVKL